MRYNEINWKEIQSYYDDGNTVKECSKYYQILCSHIYNASKKGDLKLRNGSDAAKNRVKIKGTLKHSEESKKKISENGGGYRRGSGRGKSGWYKGYWCDSSWELAWIIYNLEHSIRFIRNTEGFEYLYDEKVFKYFPDFIVEDGLYIEIKGYLDKKTSEKIKQFKYEILILDKYQIQKYINYVIDKYGKDYIRMYENSMNKTIKIKSKEVCPMCNGHKNRDGKICLSCSNISKRKVDRPPYEQLIKEIKETSYCTVGRKYGVSNNAIKKWIKNYEKELKIHDHP